MNQLRQKQRWWNKPLTKSRFCWNEPKLYLRLKDRSELPRLRRMQPWLLLGFAALLLGQWSLARMKKGATPPSVETATFIALGGGAFFAYVVPWLISKCPSQITIKEKVVSKNRANSNRFWKLATIAAFRWIPVHDWTILQLKLRNGRDVFLCVAPEVVPADLEKFFQEKGLQKEPDGHWSEFQKLKFLERIAN